MDVAETESWGNAGIIIVGVEHYGACSARAAGVEFLPSDSGVLGDHPFLQTSSIQSVQTVLNDTDLFDDTAAADSENTDPEVRIIQLRIFCFLFSVFCFPTRFPVSR